MKKCLTNSLRAVFANNLLQLSIDALKVIVGGIQKTATSKLQAKHPFTLNGIPFGIEVSNHLCRNNTLKLGIYAVVFGF